MSVSAREAAYTAVLQATRQEKFAKESLEDWQAKENPAPKDFHLAQEIAYGTIRRAHTLDFYAGQLAEKKQLKLKTKELILLRTALYQYYFMDRIPLYALTNETMEIAKKYCHRIFCGFMNALLRDLDKKKIELPRGTSYKELSINYSYPEFFVKAMLKDYGIEKAIKILEAGNETPVVMARDRENGSKMVTVNGIDAHNGSRFYIQDATPVKLMQALAEDCAKPKHILDLCSSPGGKLILAHDLYPTAELFANDVNEEKLKRIEENLARYGIKASLRAGKGEEYPTDHPFDLIILDVPCSNTGVLNKRPEARWRLSEQSVADLEKIQLRLLEHAKKLLTPDGQIWYMTCSILKGENEGIIAKAAASFDLEIVNKKTFLPGIDGSDGGFGAVLARK